MFTRHLDQLAIKANISIKAAFVGVQGGRISYSTNREWWPWNVYVEYVCWLSDNMVLLSYS